MQTRRTGPSVLTLTSAAGVIILGSFMKAHRQPDSQKINAVCCMSSTGATDKGLKSLCKCFFFIPTEDSPQYRQHQ